MSRIVTRNDREMKPIGFFEEKNKIIQTAVSNI